MIELYHVKQFINNSNKNFKKYSKFINYVKNKYCNCILQNKNPNDDLIESMLISKVICTNYAINQTFQLKKIIGSRALLEKNGFGKQLDILFCCLFAEGDNKILLQKIARDNINKLFKQNILFTFYDYIMSNFRNNNYYNNQYKLFTLIKKMLFIDKNNYGIEWNNNMNYVMDFSNNYCQFKINNIISKL
jgi:hypothetical protein